MKRKHIYFYVVLFFISLFTTGYLVDWNPEKEKISCSESTVCHGSLWIAAESKCNVTVRYADSNNIVFDEKTSISTKTKPINIHTIIDKPTFLIITWEGFDESETKILITLSTYKRETLELYGHTGDARITFALKSNELLPSAYSITNALFSKSITRIVQNGTEIFNKQPTVTMQLDPNTVHDFIQNFNYEDKIQEEILKHVTKELEQIFENNPNVSDKDALILINKKLEIYLTEAGVHIDQIIITTKGNN